MSKGSISMPRKAGSSNSNSTMRKPTPEKKIKDFRLTANQCSSLMIDDVFNNLPTIQWSNVNTLIDESIKCYHDTLESTRVFNSIVTSLESIHQKTKNNATLASYSLKCSHYLKQDHIKRTEEIQQSTRTRNATLITSQCNDEYYDELVSGSHETLEEREDSEDPENSEVDDEEVDFPSDLTVNHHPQRNADYTLLYDDLFIKPDDQCNDSDWIMDTINISDMCKSVKANTMGLRINPANLS
ncbi:uncharacterized protein EV154DRAFT_569440 [Mucor mucedo]|uniref:uncharacterized protein n=1 Tax=Mucor mucedo TaxID=29922 RepID=UPI0022209E44|nr:uncharacterized protein EV154DRAFT_569440 [Mucor mucedo]KAI7875756.1 hypothetical protein EV154DRAFT_569440 [Mucor mucedo]